MTAAFGLTLGFLAVQVVVGIVADSLAVQSDAGHMATDVLGLGMALAAVRLASRQTEARSRTFGLYRVEILAALANAVLLFGVAGYVGVEAARRLGGPPDVGGGAVMFVGAVGLAVNLVAFFLLRGGAAESINVRAAYLEVVSDALGSVGVLVSGAILAITGWGYVDPIVAAAIGVFILPRAWRLGRDAVRILVQAAPPGVELELIRADLTAIPGVVDVHDLHVWTLTSEMEVATAHVMVAAGTDTHAVLDQARGMLADRHGLAHATLQVEPDDHEGCDEVTWSRLGSV